MAYAIISVGGKQYRVFEGEKLLVDRLRTDEGASFAPPVLLLGGDGETQLSPAEGAVTARVVQHVLGEKIRIGKYKPKSGYKKHTGFRSRLTQIEIEAIGGSKPKSRSKAAAEPAPAEPAPEPTPAKEEAAPAPRTSHPPAGFEGMTVAQIKEQAGDWRRPQLEAALEHERAGSNRKGAIAALEAAIAAKES